MKKNILEQIIRQVLSEASITVDIETLRPDDERKMKTVHTMLKMNSRLKQETDRFSAADGFLIKIKRVGGRVKDDTTGEKSFEISDSDIMQNAIFKLNTLVGTYSKMNSSEYVWLLTHDVNLRKKDIEKAKASRIIATYIVQAFYIKRSLIPKPLSTSTAGYIDTLSKGALVFDLQKIDENQWITTTNVDPGEVSQTGEFGIPMKELQYKQKSVSQVPILFSYFAQNLFKILSPTETENLVNSLKTESVYGDFHRAFVESFQQEQKLTVTGNWDAATLQRALQLENPTYIFENTADLKSRIDKAIAATRSIIDVGSITVPAGGFKYKVTDNDPEFAKVQSVMISWLQKNGIDKSAKHSTKFNEWQTALNKQTDGIFINRGDFGDGTKYFVELIKKVPSLGLGNDYTIVNQNFIDAIK